DRAARRIEIAELQAVARSNVSAVGAARGQGISAAVAVPRALEGQHAEIGSQGRPLAHRWQSRQTEAAARSHRIRKRHTDLAMPDSGLKTPPIAQLGAELAQHGT